MYVHIHAPFAACTPRTPILATTDEAPSQLQCRRFTVLPHLSGRRRVLEKALQAVEVAAGPARGRSSGESQLSATQTGRALAAPEEGLSRFIVARTRKNSNSQYGVCNTRKADDPTTCQTFHNLNKRHYPVHYPWQVAGSSAFRVSDTPYCELLFLRVRATM